MGMDNSGRDQVKFEGLSTYRYGVTGVVTTIVTADKGGICRKQIDHTALSFITPLGTDYYMDRHGRLLLLMLALLVFFGIDRSDIGQITPLFIDIQTIPHHKNIGNGETKVINGNINTMTFYFIQKRANL
jgi:hypothetical protein